MYELIIEDYFASAHNLREYNGDCEQLHGHNWKIQVIVEISELNQLDLGIDFRDLKRYLKEVIGQLDHKYLNDIEFFKNNNPTTENISRFIYQDLKEKLKEHKNVRLKKVISWEEIDAGASFFE